jgi:benzoate-CoA ligase family protein
MSAALHLPRRFNATRFYVDRHLEEGRGGKVAIFWGEQKLTYRQVSEQVNRASNALRRAGIMRGDRVLLILFDSPAFVAAFWGAIKIGAIPIPTNSLLASEEYEFMLKDSGARGLVAESALIEKLAPALGGIRRLACVWVVGTAREGEKSFERDLAQSSPRASAAATGRDDPAFWLYTSGSTGRPKASIHLQHDMVACLETFGKHVLAISARDVTFSTSKLFFAYGLGNALHFPFGVGAATVLVPEKPTPERILEVLRRYRPTIFYAVPSIYAAMLRAEGAGAGDFLSVRCASSAGEPLPAPIWKQFKEKFGAAIIDGIGSTEMLHTFISNRSDDVMPGSSGKPVPGYDVKIVHDRSGKGWAGKVGELWVRGESAAAGYWRRPELTRASFHGKWTRTGDRYFCDAQGYYWYEGRNDDMMKVSGMWVSPVEIESALLTHPGVLECAVVCDRDSQGLTKPKAFVVLKGALRSASPSERELTEFLRARLPRFKVPRSIVFCPELPRTATGKVQRFKLRRPIKN